MKSNNQKTLHTCYAATAVLAVLINLAPLFFVLFAERFSISTGSLTLLVTFNFLTQLAADAVTLPIARRFGLRRPEVVAHLLCALGLVLFSLLPHVMDPFWGLLLSVMVYSFGNGMQEALSNPLCNAIPKDNMSGGLVLMHSFYCWGQLATVLLSTLLLHWVGDAFWWIIPLLWAILPLVTALRFAFIPFEEKPLEASTSPKTLLSQKGFVLCLVMIVFGCASEQAMSQWASFFAETGLGVSKMTGDLLGVCLFAACMGLCRILYAKFGKGMTIRFSLMASCVGCLICYLVAALSPIPLLSLIFCALTGFMTALMCPNILNLANYHFGGSTASFILLLAFADLGCMIGPSVTGKITELVQNSQAAAAVAEKTGLALSQVGIRGGLLLSAFFPILLFVLLACFRYRETRLPRDTESGR